MAANSDAVRHTTILFGLVAGCDGRHVLGTLCHGLEWHWIANKIPHRFFSTLVSSLCGIFVADVYFTHERGRIMSIFTLFIVGGTYVSPIVFGFVADGQDWH